MKLGILFYNIGPYHLARIRSAMEECAPRGIDVHAVQIARSTAEHAWGTVELSDKITSLAPFRDGGDQDTQVGESRALTDALDRISPDLLAVPGWGFDYSRAAMRWCRQHRRHIILMSESKADDARRNRFKEFLKRRLLSSVGAALVGGRCHADYLRSLGIPCDRIFMGYDVVDNSHFEQLSRTLKEEFFSTGRRPEFLPRGSYFLACSRFLPRKNLDRLVRAFGIWRDSRAASSAGGKLVILGSGPEEPALRQIIAEQNLKEHVQLPGFVTYDHVVAWYAFADALIHPALVEQWGLVTNEAMACGTPVVLSRTCGSAELIIHGQSGLLVDPHNDNDLVDAMTTLAADPHRRAAMGKMALSEVNRLAPTRAFGEGMLAAARACLS